MKSSLPDIIELMRASLEPEFADSLTALEIALRGAYVTALKDVSNDFVHIGAPKAAAHVHEIVSRELKLLKDGLAEYQNANLEEVLRAMTTEKKEDLN